LTTVPEGLEVSESPCAQVLSVAGFSAFIWRFPGWEGFILRVKEVSFLLLRPCLFDNPGITVTSGSQKVCLVCTGCVQGVYRAGCVQGGTPTQGTGEAYTRIYTTRVYQEGYQEGYLAFSPPTNLRRNLWAERPPGS